MSTKTAIVGMFVVLLIVFRWELYYGMKEIDAGLLALWDDGIVPTWSFFPGWLQRKILVVGLFLLVLDTIARRFAAAGRKARIAKQH